MASDGAERTSMADERASEQANQQPYTLPLFQRDESQRLYRSIQRMSDQASFSFR